MGEQLPLWEKPEPITVHCIFCPYLIHTGDGPDHAHDLMEGHYEGKHQKRIDEIVSTL